MSNKVKRNDSCCQPNVNKCSKDFHRGTHVITLSVTPTFHQSVILCCSIAIARTILLVTEKEREEAFGVRRRTNLLGLVLDVDEVAGPAVEVGAHEGVDLGEEAGADGGGADEGEHGAPHGAVERAVDGGDVVAAQDVQHRLRVARDEAAAFPLLQHLPVQLRVHAHHRGAAQDVGPEQAPVPTGPPVCFVLKKRHI